MRIGYNTNGLAHHSLPAAIRLLADLGYQSVALTLDHASLNPYDANHQSELAETAALLVELDMRSVIETGARYLLDPMHKHEPTLVSPRDHGRPKRVEFLRRAIDAAVALESDCVSLWSGVLPLGVDRDTGMQRLVEGLHAVVDYAERRGVRLGFEPEPGMLIDTMAAFEELLARLDGAPLHLTLDVGHLHCLGETPLDAVIRRWQKLLLNVHIEDMRYGIHEHLMFGEGEILFAPVIAALAEIDYQGGLHVELSRHSHVGPVAACQAYAFLNGLMRNPRPVSPPR